MRILYIYRTATFRLLFWILLVLLLVAANYALSIRNHSLMLLVGLTGALISAVCIGIERLLFKAGEIAEPAYTTRVIRQVALLAISLGFSALALMLVTGIID
jgi:hypothetical protein